MGPDVWLWMGAWVLALLVFVWLLARDPRPSRAAGPRDDAMETLRSRFARGELTEEEFDRARELLGKQAGGRHGA